MNFNRLLAKLPANHVQSEPWAEGAGRRSRWARGLRHYVIGLAAIFYCAQAPAEKITIRIGYFPNVTHAQAIIGSHTTRMHQGWFEARLGPEVVLQWFAFNAGPSAMEAIFAGSIDLTYVGPNPALNAYVRSQGEEIRLLAGAALGGAALVVPSDGRITRAADFRGRRIATPQLGNTQDVAARVWLKRQGFKITLTGGDVAVIPTANADQLPLFQQGKIDAVWTVEPWVSRLELEAGGKVWLEQSEAVTTLLVGRVAFLKNHRLIAEKFCRAHLELTNWLQLHPAEAQGLVRAGLSAEAKREIPAELIASAWRRLKFTDQITAEQLQSLVADAQLAGFMRNAIPLDQLFTFPQ